MLLLFCIIYRANKSSVFSYPQINVWFLCNPTCQCSVKRMSKINNKYATPTTVKMLWIYRIKNISKILQLAIFGHEWFSILCDYLFILFMFHGQYVYALLLLHQNKLLLSINFMNCKEMLNIKLTVYTMRKQQYVRTTFIQLFDIQICN